jgi:hypothetical protein
LQWIESPPACQKAVAGLPWWCSTIILLSVWDFCSRAAIFENCFLPAFFLRARNLTRVQSKAITTVPSTIVPCKKRGIYPSDRGIYPKNPYRTIPMWNPCRI